MMRDHDEQYEGDALSELAKAITAFANERADELGIDRDMVPNVMISLVGTYAVNMHIGTQADVFRYDEAMREIMPRLYDASLSIKDWCERKAPWRTQSSAMRDAMKGAKKPDLRRYGGPKHDA